jgi:hypothetical protein
MTQLKLTQRPAKVGNQIQSRSETHGNDSVTAFDIPFKGVMLTAEELNDITGEAHAFNSLFDTSGGLEKPLFDCFKAFALRHKFQGGTVKIKHGLEAEEIVLTACKIAKIKLEPKTGGMTECCFTVQTIPTLDERAAHLLECLNSEVEIEISAELSAEDAQRDLPLDVSGDEPKDVTRFIDPEQEERNADTERQLSEALRGLETVEETA